MSLSVKQIGQVSAQLKSQIEQFEQSLDQNDVFIGQVKSHFSEANEQLRSLSTSMSNRESDAARIRDSLEFAEIAVSSLQSSASVLDNDAMQTSRLWETVYSQASSGTAQYGGNAVSSGRVVFTVPSPYFESLSNRALVEATTLDSILSELVKIEEFYAQSFKDAQRSSDIDEKVRQAMLQQILLLKSNAAVQMK